MSALIEICPRCRVTVVADERHVCADLLSDPARAPSICQQTLQTALELTGGDRAKTHGDKRTNHQNIADLWNAYLRDDGPLGKRRLSAHDVAVMMCLLKIARLKSGTHNPDNYVDLAGYAGIAAECAE